MTGAPYDPARLREDFELFADACTLPSLRENLAHGYDLREGARILAHRAQVERVKASLVAEEQRLHHRDAPARHRVSEADRGYAYGWLLTRLTLLLVTGLTCIVILAMAVGA